MDRTTFEQTSKELLDATDKLQDLIIDVRAIAARLRQEIDD